MRSVKDATRWTLLAVTLTALVAGGVAWLLHAPAVADGCWIAGTVAALIPALWWLIAALGAGRLGVDVLAVLSLGGALAVGEYLAGALIGVMLATGQALDAAAERRATKDLRALLDRAPRTARRRVGDDVEVVAVDEVAVDDVVIVGPGEVLPVDGLVLSEAAVLDESALTGESLHGAPGVRRSVAQRRAERRRRPGDAGHRHGGRQHLRRHRRAGAAGRGRDGAGGPAGRPVSRPGSCRWRWPWPVSPGCSAGRPSAPSPSWWWPHRVRCCWPPRSRSCRGCRGPRGSGCWSAAAARSKHSAGQRTLVLDKTGTLTIGPAARHRHRGGAGLDSRPRSCGLAASADQLSPHILAAAIVAEARLRDVPLTVPTAVSEEAGTGVAAVVDGRRVAVGNLRARRRPARLGGRGGVPRLVRRRGGGVGAGR